MKGVEAVGEAAAAAAGTGGRGDGLGRQRQTVAVVVLLKERRGFAPGGRGIIRQVGRRELVWTALWCGTVRGTWCIAGRSVREIEDCVLHAPLRSL